MGENRLRRIRSVFVGLIALAGVVFAVRAAQGLPDGPEPIAWDREACAHCRMHIGDPRFAAQLQTTDGQVLDFDDPGCLLRYLSERKLGVHAIYLHELRGSRWLQLEQVAFVEAGVTPMGYGLGVVQAGTPGALGLEAAQKRLAQGHLAKGGTP